MARHIAQADSVEFDMADVVHQEQRYARGRSRDRQALALAVGDERIATAMHQDEVAAQLREIVEREIEPVDFPANVLRQRRDQGAHRVRVAVVDQRQDSPSLRPKRRGQGDDVGTGVAEAEPGDLLKPARVGGIANTAGIGQKESPPSVPVGFQPEFAAVAYGTEHTGRHQANDCLDVVVAADTDQEGNSRREIVLQRGDNRGRNGI